MSLLPPKMYLFPGTKDSVVERWLPDLLGKWDVADKGDKDRQPGREVKATEAPDKRRKSGASKMTEPWAGRMGR